MTDIASVIRQPVAGSTDNSWYRERNRSQHLVEQGLDRGDEPALFRVDQQARQSDDPLPFFLGDAPCGRVVDDEKVSTELFGEHDSLRFAMAQAPAQSIDRRCITNRPTHDPAGVSQLLASRTPYG